MKKLLLTLLVCFGVASCIFGAADLKLSYKVGQSAVYGSEISFKVGDISINGQSVPMPMQEMAATGTITQTCVAKDAEGNGTVCCRSITKLGSEEQAKEVVSYTKSIVDRRGRVKKLLEIEENGKKTVFKDKDKEKQPLMTSLTDLLNQGGYPEKPVEVGETWEVKSKADAKNSVAFDLLYKLEAVNEVEGEQIAVISCTGTMEMNVAEVVKLMGSAEVGMPEGMAEGIAGTAVVRLDKCTTELSLTKGLMVSSEAGIAVQCTIKDEVSGMDIQLNTEISSLVKLAQIKNNAK